MNQINEKTKTLKRVIGIYDDLGFINIADELEQLLYKMEDGRE